MPEPLQELLAGRVRCVEYSGGRVYVDAPRGPGRVYLPGSFNPLHEGHRQMLAAAVRLAGPEAEGCFEITVKNADKVRRVQQPPGLTGLDWTMLCWAGLRRHLLVAAVGAGSGFA